MELRELLESYTKTSLKLIKEIKEDANTEELMKERENILSEIEQNNLSKDEKFEIGKEFNILELEALVGEYIKEEQMKVKEEIRKTRVKKQANKGYKENINSINFFNTKV